VHDARDFQRLHHQWVETTLAARESLREGYWSEAIAVGNLAFIESVKSELRGRATRRTVDYSDGAYALREQGEAYNGDFGGKTEPLSIQNAVYWNENPESADT
jgi:hypothetical protein